MFSQLGKISFIKTCAIKKNQILETLSNAYPITPVRNMIA